LELLFIERKLAVIDQTANPVTVNIDQWDLKSRRRHMKRLIVVLCVLAAGLAAPLFGQKVDRQGKIWLDAKHDAVEVNVNGTWTSKSWGRVVLNQAAGARDIVGTGDGWDVLGAVSGKQVYLIFSSRGRIMYSAELTADGPDTLNGGYCRGLLFPGSKTKPMHLAK
jgi:hypothetical protein